jgi:hypothetical protein
MFDLLTSTSRLTIVPQINKHNIKTKIVRIMSIDETASTSRGMKAILNAAALK